MSTQHTVMLLQFDAQDPHSRTYLDFDTVNDAMDGLAQIYENKMKAENPDEDVSYDMRGLSEFIDTELADAVTMVFDETQKIYVPHGKEWL